MKCNVCREREAVGVACSAAGPVSLAYCAECLRERREPYWALVALLFGMSSMDEVAKWYRPIIEATLKAENKSVEEFFMDVALFTGYIQAFCPSEHEKGDEDEAR